PERDDLLPIEAEKGEHTALARYEREIDGRRALRELVDEQPAKLVQACAHLADLPFPQRTKLRVAEDSSDDGSTMIGRHRVDSARHVRGVTRDAPRVLRARRHDADGADALPVEPEVLRAARNDDGFRKPLAHHPHAVSILVEPFREPLIREIDERHDAAPLTDLRERAPLLALEVRTARVVTAAVQQQQITRRDA